MVAGSVPKVSVRWSAPSSRISTSSPASRSRPATGAPPAPVPTTIASAVHSWSPCRSAPSVTLGYSSRYSGGTGPVATSGCALIEQLGAPARERPRAPGPVDPEGGEHVRVLVEAEEDERPQAE